MKTLVLGMGNPILCDDGAGIYAARLVRHKLKRRDVTVEESSLAGLDLLEQLANYDRVIIIDAIEVKGLEPGGILRFSPEELVGTKHTATPHDINFVTSLELGRLLGMPLPGEIIIFGIQAGDVSTFSECCTPAVERAIDKCVAMVLAEIKQSRSRSRRARQSNSRN